MLVASAGSAGFGASESACCYVPTQKKILVFGGRLKDQRTCSDLYSFNTGEPLSRAETTLTQCCMTCRRLAAGLMAWEKLQATGVSPPARCNHTATLIDSKVFVYGGVASDASTPLDDVFALNTGAFATGS